MTAWSITIDRVTGHAWRRFNMFFAAEGQYPARSSKNYIDLAYKRVHKRKTLRGSRQND